MPFNPAGVTVLTSGSGTYTVPVGCTALWVRLIGGGGGGGGATPSATFWCQANGGGGGSYCEGLLTSLAGSYSYAVGAGGTGGSSGSVNGSNGGDTTFGALTAGGGLGAASNTNISATQVVVGTTGGTASGGDINAMGMPSMEHERWGPFIVHNGAGGGNWGNAGNSRSNGNTSANGHAAGTYGAGGGGATSGGSNSGGNGSAGVIIIWEFEAASGGGGSGPRAWPFIGNGIGPTFIGG